MRVVGLLGQPFWVARLSQLLIEHASETILPIAIVSWSDLPKLRGADVLVRVGYRPGASTWRGVAFDSVWRLAARLSPRAAHACYWIGTDVANARTDRRGQQSRRFRRACSDAIHWAGAPWLAEELEAIGVPAVPLLFPAWLPPDGPLKALPDQMRIITYVPDARPAFYGANQLLAAVEAFPDVEFRVFGGRGAWLRCRPANLHFDGWLTDVAAAYQASTALVRLTEHDALGGTVREALALGRHVIFSYRVPYATHVEFGDAEGLKAAIANLRQRHTTGNLRPNEEGAAYARTHFDPRSLTIQFAEALRSCAT